MFGFGKSDAPRRESPPEPHDPAKTLAELFESRKQTADGRIRAENLLSAAAAVTGEFCIRSAREFDPDHHDFYPGSLVASDTVNLLLFADQEDLKALPESTVFGAIRKGALERGYSDSDFPSIADIIRQPAEGKTDDGDPPAAWGRVNLDVSRDHLPKISPLQDAYLLRAPVIARLTSWGVPLNDQAVTCARATAMVLGYVSRAIDPKIALQIVFGTANGMAKMAPMTAKHIAEMQLKVGKGRVVF
jgi:hypothetical protein